MGHTGQPLGSGGNVRKGYGEGCHADKHNEAPAGLWVGPAY